MKRVLFFLLLVGLGLAALFYVDRRNKERERLERESRTEQQEVPDFGPDFGPRPEVQRPSVEATGEPAEEGQEAEEAQGLQFVLAGDTAFTQPGPDGRRLYSFEGFLEPQPDGTYTARGVTVVQFEYDEDLDRTVPAITSLAERARLRLVMEEGQPAIDTGRVELFEVVATQERGGVLVPLVFRAPRLLLDTDEEAFTSVEDDVVEVEGPGLFAEGRGLEVRGVQESFEFQRGGRIRFLGAEEEEQSELAQSVDLDTRESKGLVRVERREDGSVRAITRKRARLTARAPESETADSDLKDTIIDADELELIARPDTEEALRSEKALARGNVIARRGTDRMTGQEADLDILADGRVSDVLLTGDPRIFLRIFQEQEDEDGQVTEQEIDVVISGVGPMTADLRGPLRFQMLGASQLEAVREGARITATESIEGEIIPDSRHGEFLAKGDVRLNESRFQLQTPELWARLPGGDQRALDMEARGRTLASSPEFDLELVAEGGLSLQRRGEIWSMPEAREVTVGQGGEEPWELQGGLILDFNWITQSFEVRDGLRFQGFEFEAVGTEATVRGPEFLELRGDADQVAWLRSFDGTVYASATRLLRNKERLEGEGNVNLELRAAEDSETQGSVVVESAYVRLDVAPEDEDQPEAARAFELYARDVGQARIESPDESTWLGGDELTIQGEVQKGEDPEAASLVASGEVDLHYRGPITVDGLGERFEIFPDGKARLSAAAGKRVNAWGDLGTGELPYEMTADWIEYDPEGQSGIRRAGSLPTDGRIEAKNPHIVLQTVLLPISPLGEEDDQSRNARFTDAKAESMIIDDRGVLLAGDVRIEGRDRDGRLVSVTTEQALLVPSQNEVDDEAALPLGSIEKIELQEGFRIEYADRAKATGEWALITPRRAVFRGEFHGAPAQVKVAGISLESQLIDVDLVDFLVATQRGILRATGPTGAWSLRFASMIPIEEDAETMVVIGAPIYDAGPGSGARADWGVLWVHADTWRERASQELFGLEPTAGLDRMVVPPLPIMDLLPNVFRDLKDQSAVRFSRAIYLDGNAEVTEGGQSVARGDTMYLDLVEAQGWMRGAELLFPMEVGGETQLVRTRSEELYTASDGTLAAEKATLTACLHEDPHYEVETGGLRIEPRAKGGWRISARRNLLRFQNGLQLPLPPLGDVVLDDAGGFRGFETRDGEVYGVESLNLSNSARFGTSVRTGLNSDIGRVGKGVGSVLGFDPKYVEGRWTYDGSWLGSRGVLLGLGLRLRDRRPDREEPERFWLNLFASGVINDEEQDRGINRVPVDERDSTRTWYRLRGRYPFSSKTWVDVAFSTQSDPGVQSEFYQRRFLRWEERDTFIHWRSANNGNYFNADARFRTDDFRTEVERLPALGAYHGRAKLFDVFGVPVLYGTEVDVEYLRRLQGDERFEFVFPDEATDRTALRVDNRHFLEAPMALGFGGLRLTPFTEARITAWSEGLDPEDEPTRAALLAGGEISGTYWKKFQNDFVHTITPSVRWRSDVAFEEQEGPPIFFDAKELPIEGTELDIGLRNTWRRPGARQSLDIETRAVERSNLPDGAPDRWQLLTLATYRDRIGGWPVALSHDGRLDFDLNSTLYSFTRFGFSPNESLVIEMSHRRGADELGARLFEAATLAARWTVNPKWEFEGRQTFSLINSGALNNAFILRRYSHDALLEIGVDYQDGEGGTFSLSWRPRFGWERRPLGLIRAPDYQ